MADPHPQALLDAALRKARRAEPGKGARIVTLCGPLGVGKADLITAFAARVDVPCTVIDGLTGDPAIDRWRFHQAVRRQPGSHGAQSTHPHHAGGDTSATHTIAGDWNAALADVAENLTADQSLLVLEHLDRIADAECFLHALADAMPTLGNKPLLIVATTRNADFAEQLTAEPLRARHIRVTGHDATYIQRRFGCTDAEAIDLHTITSGLPQLINTLGAATNVATQLAATLDNPFSPLHVLGERCLVDFLAETSGTPGIHHQRAILEAIAAGNRSHARIAAACPAVPRGSFSRLLGDLVHEGWVTAALPSTGAKSKETRYRIADPYLSWWLWAISPHREALLREDTTAAKNHLKRGFATWAADAVIPTLRTHVQLHPEICGLAPQTPITVGGFWNRTGDAYVPLVIRHSDDGQVLALGAVDWHGDAQGMVAALHHAKRHIAGCGPATTAFAITRSTRLLDGSCPQLTLPQQRQLTQRAQPPESRELAESPETPGVLGKAGLPGQRPDSPEVASYGARTSEQG